MKEIQVDCKNPHKHRDEVEDALRVFKREVKKSGLMQELRRREHYLSPSKAKRVKRNEALKQRKRDERKQDWNKSNDF